MSTTTFSAIRSQIVTVVKALTPSAPIDSKFDACPTDMMLRDWAVHNATDACFRKFDVWDVSGAQDPETFDPTQVLRSQRTELTVAYPVNVGLYGVDDLYSMADVIRADARKIRDAIVSPGNLISGWQGAIDFDIQATDRALNPWFQVIAFTVIFDEAQTIT